MNILNQINKYSAIVQYRFGQTYGASSQSYFLAFFQSALNLIIYWILFTVLGRKVILGLPIPIFLLTGLIPIFMVTQHLLMFIKIFNVSLDYRIYDISASDLAIAYLFLEHLIKIIVFLILLASFYWLGYEFYIYNITNIFFMFCLLYFLVLGLSLIFSIVLYYFPNLKLMGTILNRFIFYTSGFFFTIEMVPYWAHKYILINPLYHIITIFRYAFINQPIPSYTNINYILLWVLGSVFWGFSLYIINRKNIYKDIEQQ